jgi:hypothetical protein
MLVYQLDQHVFGHVRATFKWHSDGSIRGTVDAVGLPGVAYVTSSGSPDQFTKVSCARGFTNLDM